MTQQGILGYHTAFVGANGAPIRYAVVVSPGGAAHNRVLPEAATAIAQQTAVTVAASQGLPLSASSHSRPS